MTKGMARRAVVRGAGFVLPLLLSSTALPADDVSASEAATAGAIVAAAVPAASTPATASPAAAPDAAVSSAVRALDVPPPSRALPSEVLPAPVLDAPPPAAEDLPPLAPTSPEAAAVRAPGAVTATLDPDALRQLAREDMAALGPLSIGTPDAGLLVNPRPMPDGPMWTIRNPLETWGTQETIDFVAVAIESVNARFPGSPRVVIGDMSRRDGGRLNRHKSHQAGRDVDVGFYYADGEAGDFRLVPARTRRRTAVPLDLPRTWALVRSFLTETDVDRIFVDRSLIALLYRHARQEEGEDPAWLDDVFGRGERKGIIQHERRHKDHLHVRFFNRVAQEKGRIVYPTLVETGAVGPPTVKHVVRRGETLGHLASRYGTSVSAIKAANGLRTSQLRAGRAYLVPVRKVRADDVPLVVPPRRLPPPLPAQASVRPEALPVAPAATPPAAAADGRN